LECLKKKEKIITFQIINKKTCKMKTREEMRNFIKKQLSYKTEEVNPLNGKKETHTQEEWMCIAMHSKGVDYKKMYLKRGAKPPIEL